MSKIQSVLFDNRKWSIPKAEQWLKENNFKNIKIDVTPRYYRFRQFNPKDFKKFRTETTTKGISFIIGF